MSSIVVEGRYSHHSSFCHLDNFRYAALPFLPEDILLLLRGLEGGGRATWRYVHDWNRKDEFVHLLILVGRIACIFTLPLNSLLVSVTTNVDVLSRVHAHALMRRWLDFGIDPLSSQN
jgi:hypothetical protein